MDRGRVARGCGVRTPAEDAGGSVERSPAVSGGDVQRVAGDLRSVLLRGVRVLRLHRAVPAARSGTLAPARRSLDAALVGRLRGRLAAGAGPRAPDIRAERHG